MNEVKILSFGGYVPEKIVTNDDLMSVVDTTDEWISSRTGIRQRRISEGDNTSDLATKAAIIALERANIKPEDLDLIILATTSPDSFMPSSACIVQGAIGAVNAFCFDINAACSGFLFALNTASQFIKTGQCRLALVIGAEVLSKIIDWTDRNTCVLFGDGAGAAIITASEDPGILSLHCGSDGSKGIALTCPAVPLSNLFVKADYAKSYITMDGKEVFKFATRVIPASIKWVLKDANLTIEDIKYIVPHQANIRIIESAAKKIGIGINKFYINLPWFGNTSSASIPIALNEMYEKGLLQCGDKIIAVGFGGGLTWGAVLIEI
jgi:3-oxoacyl-[acyl-carrier-protein] synthase III